jgi:septation ring formation regulator EzrA
LQQKLELLDKDKLDYFYRRIKSLQVELDNVEDRKKRIQLLTSSSTNSVSASAGQNISNIANISAAKIDQLFDSLTKWDKTGDQLPAVIARLQSLKDLHEQTALAVTRLHAVHELQSSVDVVLKEDQKAIKKLGESMQENANMIQANVATLESRMDSINEKLERLAKYRECGGVGAK